MHLAYIKNPERGATDRTLTALAARLQEMGVITAGIVQINVEICDSELCDMDVRVLPGGETIRISQSLGPNSTGCRLNPEALEKAVGLVQETMQQHPKPQVLLVNKFGKHEADGRGMRVVIAEALEQGLPVVLGVNGANVDAFLAFTGGMGEAASCDVEELASWVKSHLK